MFLSVRIAAVAIALAAPNLSSGEEIYKSTMPSGSIVYGESPAAGAQKVEKVEVRSTPTGTIVATPQDKERAERMSPSGPAVGVMQQKKRPPAPALESGTITPPGVMPEKSY